MNRYAAVFVSVDTDRDGMVKGSECFPVFMQSGLDKGMLKRMWDLVAGNSGVCVCVCVWCVCVCVLGRKGDWLVCGCVCGKWRCPLAI